MRCERADLPKPLLAPPRARTAAMQAREGIGEMTLVGEANGQRNLRQRVFSLEHQRLGAADPRIQVPTVRRLSGGLAKRAAKLRRRQSNEHRKLLYPDRTGQIRLDVLGGAPQLPSSQPTTHSLRGG